MKLYMDHMTGKLTNNASKSLFCLEISLDDAFDLEKIIEIQEGEIQKTNDQGQLLYKANLAIDEMGIEAYEETTDSKRAITIQEQNQQTADTDALDHSSTKNSEVIEVAEFKALHPIMIPKLVSTTVSVKTHPEHFTLEEIVEGKYKNILEASNSNYILADIFIDENDLDLSDGNHKANTGYGILELLPQGQTQTKLISLEGSSKNFTLLEFDADQGVEIYVNDRKFESNMITFENELDRCIIKFVNTVDKAQKVRSYAVGY